MEPRFQISEDDYVNALKLAAKPSRKVIAIYSLIAAALVVLAIGGGGYRRGGAIGGLIGGGTVLLLVSRQVIRPIMARRHYKKYKAIQESFTTELLDDGVRFVSENAQTKLHWDSIFKWRRNENYLLIYTAPCIFHVVPKPVEASGFDMSLLINQLTQHVGEAK